MYKNSLILFSPGHRIPLDTLIANAIAIGVLEVDPDARVHVSKVGARYILEIKTNASGIDVATWAAKEVLIDIELEENGKIYRVLSPNRANLSSMLRNVREAAEKVMDSEPDIFTVYKVEYHSIEKKEGRHGRKKDMFPAYVPIAPWAGKYVGGGYSYRPVQYILCDLCFTLAWAGLVRSTSLIYCTRNGRREIKALIVSPDPILSDTHDIAVLGEVFGSKNENIIGNIIPILAAPFVAMATGETIFPVKGEFAVLVWDHTFKRNPRVEGFVSLPLSPLLHFVAEAKARGAKLARLINITTRDFGDHVAEPTLISLLVECLAYGSPEPYNALRELWAFLNKRDYFLEKAGHKPTALSALNKALIEALIEIYAKRHKVVL